MPMEAAAVDKLIEKGQFKSDAALAIAEAIDIAITAANLVTVPVLDARFAKVEARFSEIEKAIVDTKVWAVYLYAGLVIALFGALAVDHHWLVNRQDELNARSDQRFEALEARFREQDAKLDQVRAQQEAKLDHIRAQQEAKLDEIRALVAKSVPRQRTQQP
jgi:hypothetical protein